MPAMEDRRVDELASVAALLLFLQGAIAFSLAFEAAGGALLLGAGGLGALLSLIGAGATFGLVRGVAGRSGRSLRWARRLQYGWLTTAVVDMGLSVVLAGIGPAPTPVLTRIVLPAALIVVLRRMHRAGPDPAPAAVEVAA